MPDPIHPALSAMTSLPGQIHTWSQELGFAALGWSDANDLPDAHAHLQAWLDAGYSGDMGYLKTHPRHTPRFLLAEAQSVLMVALPYTKSPYKNAKPSEPSVARYAVGSDYHPLIRQKLQSLAEKIQDYFQKEQGTGVQWRACVDTAPLLERAFAAKCGLGFAGKSTLLIVPGLGTYTLLGALLLNVPLPKNPRIQSQAGDCGQCTRCLSGCPTDAFVAPHILDAKRCIAYLTIEYSGWIPRSLRPKIGLHLFGCDICQAVCPYNASPKPRPFEPALAPIDADHANPDPHIWLRMGSAAYKRLVRGTALARTGRNQLARNAAVVMGNRGLQQDIPELAWALHHHHALLVRGHAAWALGQIGGQQAQAALKQASMAESDIEVLEEIHTAQTILEKPKRDLALRSLRIIKS